MPLHYRGGLALSLSVGSEIRAQSITKMTGYFHKSMKKNLFLNTKLQSNSLIGYSPWGHKESDTTERLQFTSLHCHLSRGFPNRSVGKDATCNAGDPSSIPGLRRSPGKGIDYPLQYSWASLMAQLVKNPPAVWETCV